MERRAHRFYYKIEESECKGNENRCFWGACRAGKVADDNGKIEHDKYKVNGKLCKVGFYEPDIEHEIAKGIYSGKEKYIPEVFRFENLIAVRVCNSDKRIEDHNDKREVKARMTQKAFEL